MIKSSVFLICLLFITVFSFAQKSDPTGKLTQINYEGSFMNPSNNIMANISSSSNFSALTDAIKAAELTDTFSGTNQVTLFAPDNKAFDKLAPGILDTLLLTSHKAELARVLLHHAIAGKMTSKDIDRQIRSGNGRAIITTLAGDTLTAQINENRNIVLTDESGSQSVVSRFDIQQSNGILYVITSVLIPAMK